MRTTTFARLKGRAEMGSLRALDALRSRDLVHMPNRTFGVEIETLGNSSDTVRHTLRRKGYTTYGYGDPPHSYWDTKEDGSLHPDCRCEDGCECEQRCNCEDGCECPQQCDCRYICHCDAESRLCRCTVDCVCDGEICRCINGCACGPDETVCRCADECVCEWRCACEDGCECETECRCSYRCHCDDDDNSCEVTSPILRGKAGLEEISAVLDILEDNLDGYVNKSCGLHVHVQSSDLDMDGIKRVVAYYMAAQGAINSFLDPERHDAYYARTPARNDYDTPRIFRAQTIEEMTCYDKYSAVNLNHLTEYGTIEFRQHEGCLDGEKVSAWIQFCVGLVELAKQRSQDQPSMTLPWPGGARHLDEIVRTLPMDNDAVALMTQYA